MSCIVVEVVNKLIEEIIHHYDTLSSVKQKYELH